MDIIDHIAEVSPEALLLDGFDDAIIGIAERINLGPVVAYDVEKILEIMRTRDEMTYEEAYEYYEFNIKGAWMGDYTPVFVEVYEPEEYSVNLDTVEREVITFDMDRDFDDNNALVTTSGPWEVDGHVYTLVDNTPDYDSGGESYNVIIKRTTDNKFFSFNWYQQHEKQIRDGINDENFFEVELVEVFKKTKVTTIYE
jgi:hypothetical protein